MMWKVEFKEPSLLNPPSIIIQGTHGSWTSGIIWFQSTKRSNMLLAVEMSPGEQMRGMSFLIGLWFFHLKSSNFAVILPNPPFEALMKVLSLFYLSISWIMLHQGLSLSLSSRKSFIVCKEFRIQSMVSEIVLNLYQISLCYCCWRLLQDFFFHLTVFPFFNLVLVFFSFGSSLINSFWFWSSSSLSDS